jgi:hypothetical protein
MSPDRPSDPGAEQSGDESTVEPRPTRRRRPGGRAAEVWVPGTRGQSPEFDGAGAAALELLRERVRANSPEPLVDQPPEQGDDFDEPSLDEPTTVDDLGYELYVDDDEDDE